ncbi:hypothetical protein AAFF_G00336640 [Aldrovandia affinis]|uniref:alpha-N-acetylgalactosaminide alpha-2,6-sialyltransferase n=1 Tax=Aldrovandia affinis TaxID=143900 RepID=A0AAD7R6E1_9TELE|nr:hypothetical protein AAFF_G00336640 [Aldrovandia affinis]
MENAWSSLTRFAEDILNRNAVFRDQHFRPSSIRFETGCGWGRRFYKLSAAYNFNTEAECPESSHDWWKLNVTGTEKETGSSALAKTKRAGHVAVRNQQSPTAGIALLVSAAPRGGDSPFRCERRRLTLVLSAGGNRRGTQVSHPGSAPRNRMTHHRKLLALGFLCICCVLVVFLVDFSLFDMSWLQAHQAHWNRTTTVNVKKPVDLSYTGDTYAREAPVSQTHCPNSIRSRVSQTTFNKTFLMDIPVLQWLKHVSKEEHDRLRKYPGAHGWRGVSFLNLVATLSALNTSANRIMLDDWEQRANGANCIRCAVIGNGGILRGSGKGQEIDQHHYVFRVNGAVIKGFEKDVGNRTSLYTFSTNTLRNSLAGYRWLGFRGPPKSEETRYVFLPDQGRDYTLLRAATSNTNDKTASKYFGKDITPKKFKIYHPDFLRYIQNRFLRSRILKGRGKDWYRPTTGAVMLMAAMHTCDQVDAYGFLTPNYKKFSDHYYDKRFRRVVFYSNHDMRLELKVWQNLHKAGLINLYMRE